MAENYIAQSHTWSTGETITATRLNGNESAVITGLSDGSKAINLAKILIGGQAVISLSSTDVNFTNINTLAMKNDLTIYDATNDGNPKITVGSTSLEALTIQSVYDSGAQTLDYVLFSTAAASATADKGKFRFSVDGTTILDVVDAGLTLTGGLTLSGGITLNTNKFTVASASGNTTVAGTLGVTSDFAINTNKFTVTASSGNTLIAGTLGVTGSITGTLGTAAQTNITSVGTLTGLTMGGNIAMGSNSITGALGVTATNLTGTLQTAAQPNITSVGTLSSLVISGNLTVDTNTLYVDSANNRVGIGTTAPNYSLQTHNTSSVQNSIQITNGATGSGVSDGLLIGVDASGNGLIQNTESTALYFLTSNDKKMSVLANGNVGIGTNAPDKALEINSATGANLRLTYNDSNGSASNYADMSVSSGGDLTIAPSGGDTSVTGTLSATGALSGTTITGTGKISTTVTTEQMRLSYDVSNYATMTVSSGGDLTIATSGGDTSITGNLTVTGDIATVGWTDYSSTSTVSGFSSFTGKQIFYKKIGKLVFVEFYLLGTSNATTISFTLPIACNSTIGAISHGIYATNDNQYLNDPAWLDMATSSSTVNVYKSRTSTSWTDSGDKAAVGQFFYHID